MVGRRDWLEPPDLPPPAGLSQALGLSPWVAGVLTRRGFSDPQAARAFLDPRYYSPAAPEELPGIDLAASRLLRALELGERILVWGDFDVDGQTATALLVATLQELGGRVSYHVPVRAQESHGVSPEVLQRLLAQGDRPDLVLTCDTGIAAFEAAEIAQAAQIDLVITDHHELARPTGSDTPQLPEARAIVSPRFLSADHRLAGLPGVGVAYKLAEALYTGSGRTEAAEQHLDLVALGIVADVALQTGDTRYLLQRGLERLRNTPRLGLQAIYERAELKPEGLTEAHIGFVIAPRLNALGRLGDANPAVELLTTGDRGRARLLAVQLEGLNARRQLLTSQVLRGALAQIEQDRTILTEPVLVLANPAWEAGVIGIVASGLVELYGKPVVMIAIPPGGPGRASARSVEGVDITAAIGTQSALLLGFGGHAMAAGFSILPENIPAFRRGLARAVRVAQAETTVESRKLQIDAYLPWGALSLETINEVELLAPYGPGNPPLVLASQGLRLAGLASLGREQEHLQLTIQDESGLSRKVIWWGGADASRAEALPQGRFDLAYQARTSTYHGGRELQLEYIDVRPLEGPVEVSTYRPAVEDYRSENQPLAILRQLAAGQAPDQMGIWAEEEAGRKLAEHVPAGLLRRRDQLAGPLHTLVVWTSPASPADLSSVLQRTHPQRVILFAVEPESQSLQAFLQRLAGLARHVLARPEHRTRLPQLAAAAAQRELTVLRGLEWLAAKGYLTLQIDGDEAALEPGAQADPPAAALFLEQLNDLFAETKAYRAYYRRAENPLGLESNS
jgi:single-stranded-DNA-specific exonuclease